MKRIEQVIISELTGDKYVYLIPKTWDKINGGNGFYPLIHGALMSRMIRMDFKIGKVGTEW